MTVLNRFIDNIRATFNEAAQSDTVRGAVLGATLGAPFGINGMLVGAMVGSVLGGEGLSRIFNQFAGVREREPAMAHAPIRGRPNLKIVP